MTDNDIKCLLNWLNRNTIIPPPTIHGTKIETVEIDFKEGIKLHFFYSDMSSLCIKLNVDGTWNYTIGQ